MYVTALVRKNTDKEGDLMLKHTMTIAGLERGLPICRVTDDLYAGNP